MATARTRSLGAHISRIACIVALCLAHLAAAAPSAFDAWPTMGSLAQLSFHPRDMTSSTKDLPGPRNGKASGNRHVERRSGEFGTYQCPTTCRCRFFLWNAVSYVKHQHTLDQVRQNTFEGRGGKKFVRIQPNTILERWYLQYKRGQLRTDACVLCGHSWEEHLEYWWFRRRKGRRSAFDDFVSGSGNAEWADKGAFYRRYVDEIDTSKRRRKGLRKGREARKSLSGGVSYAVPSFDPEADGRPKGVGSVLLLALARAASLERLDDIIWLRRVEKSKQRP